MMVTCAESSRVHSIMNNSLQQIVRSMTQLMTFNNGCGIMSVFKILSHTHAGGDQCHPNVSNMSLSMPIQLSSHLWQPV